MRSILSISVFTVAIGLFAFTPQAALSADPQCKCNYQITISGCRGLAEGASTPSPSGGTYHSQLYLDYGSKKSAIDNGMRGLVTGACAGQNQAAIAAMSSYGTKWQGDNKEIDAANCVDSDNLSPRDSGVPAGTLINIQCQVGEIEASTPPDPRPEVDEDAYVETEYAFPDASGLNPLPAGTTVPILVGRLIRTFTGIFGSVALLMIIYGGITIMVSRAKGDEVKKGANIVLWASLGLVAMMASYALVQFVFRAIGA